jgi:hypothetical protein
MNGWLWLHYTGFQTLCHTIMVDIVIDLVVFKIHNVSEA